MSKNTIDLAAQLKAFYKIGHKYANYISPTTFTYIKRLYKELDRLLSLALQQKGTQLESATFA